MRHLIILSGPINSGKTTYLHRLIAQTAQAGRSLGGITAEAVYEEGRKTGYDVQNVTTGQRRPLVRSGGQGDAGAETASAGSEAQRVGRFYLLESGLVFAREVLQAALGMELLCLDEIGPLEIKGGGHMPALKMLLGEYRGTLIVVAREGVAEKLSQMAKEYGWQVEMRTSGSDF